MAGVGLEPDSKVDREQQERFNPVTSDLYKQEQAGYNREFNDIVNNSNISDLKDVEKDTATDDSGFYKPKKLSAYGGYATERGRGLSAQNIRAITKKRGILGLIVTIVLGGGIAGFLFTSPGIAIVQMKEVLTKDLNDQLAATDIRSSSHVFRAKLKSPQASASICSSVVNIRCKFSTMSGKGVKSFEKANIKLECEGGCKDGLLARNKVIKMTFPDGQAFTDPAAATRYARSNTGAASAMRKAYNPLYRSLSDAPAMKALSRLGVSKRSILTGSKEENDKRLKEAVKSGVNTDGRLASETSSSGDDKDTQSKKEQANLLNQELEEGTKEVIESGQKAGSRLLSGAVKSVGIIGVVDNACTVYRTGLAIEAGAKVVRATQLARYAMTFLTVADAIKAGDATPEQVEYVGNILTTTDSRKIITVPDSANPLATREIPNPAYGKSAFDSTGYKLAAYNEVSSLSSITQQYTVGGTGGVLGALTGVNAFLGKSPRDVCGVVQNNFVRVGSLIVGVLAGALSGGGTIATTVAVNATLNIALTFAEQMLVDLLAGTVVDDATTGSQAGDAIFAGSSVIMGNVAAAHGLSPLTLDGIKNYTVAKAEVDDRHIAMDKYDAKEQPYDINNKYTFVGSLAYSLNNTHRVAGNNIFSTFSSLIAAPLNINTAGALSSTFNPERYQQCDDQSYKDLNLAPDAFCNLRFGLSDQELSLDTDTVVKSLVESGDIDATTGEPKSEDFSNYIKNCTERTTPFGNGGDEEQNASAAEGADCVKQEQKYQYYRVYLIDKSISDSIDGEEPTTQTASQTDTEQPATPSTTGSAIRGDDYPYKTSPKFSMSPLGYGFRECVDFVAWRLNTQSGITQAPFKFSGYGHAISWRQNAISGGFAVDKKPAVGSVAWWGNGVSAVTTASGYGHVAIVSQVNADGSIIVEQYNGMAFPNDHKYSTDTIPASLVGNLDYLHIADIKEGSV